MEEQADTHDVPLGLFGAMECVGDPSYLAIGERLDPKAVAYGRACKRLNVKPDDSIAIEDSDSGLAAANAAGLICIGLREPSNQQRFNNALIVVPDLRDLLSGWFEGLILSENTRDVVVSTLRAHVPDVPDLEDQDA